MFCLCGHWSKRRYKPETLSYLWRHRTDSYYPLNSGNAVREHHSLQYLSCRGQIIETPCPVCSGAGRVRSRRTISINVPAGADSGMTLRLSGEGDAGEPGAPSGDLYIIIHVMEHKYFKRVDYDVISELSISFTQAALGADVMVDTLYGQVKMNIPSGTQTHSVFRLKDKGIQRLHGHGKGTSS